MEVALVIVLALVGGSAVGGILLARQNAQARMDMTHRHYTVNFPRDVKFDDVLAFMRALGGLTTKKWVRLGGLITVVLEVEADMKGIRHRISMPGHVADSVIGDLRASGFQVTPDKIDAEEAWDVAVELRMTDHDKSLSLGNPEATIRTILSKFQPLKEGEAILMQWTAAPMFPQAPTDDKDHKEKRSTQNFQVIGRLAARGKDPEALIRRVFNGLSSVKAYGVSFKEKRLVHKGLLHKRIVLRNASFAYACTLNAIELGVLACFPAGNPNVPGLAGSRTRHIAADYRIPEVGFKVGMSNYPGAERPLAISALDRTKHTYIVGPTGVGKSTLIANLAVQEILAGYGTAVFDPKGGDLITDVADSIPRERYGDVILFDPTDTQMPIGLNVLEGDDPYLITDQQMAVWDGLYNIYSMPRTADVLRSGVLTLAQVGMTLMDLPMLLSSTEGGKDFRAAVLKQIPDRSLRAFWQWFDGEKPGAQSDITAPLLRRLRPFELRPSLRATLGQTKSGFDMKDVIENKKILLVSLAKGQLGEETSALFGALMVGKLWNAVQARSAIPIADREPFFAHIDEFHNYLHVPMSLADMLAESRAYGFGLTLAHQNLSQLPPNLRDAVLANARSKIIFQTAANDATTMAREFAPYVSASDLMNLGPYEVVMRLATGGEVSPPATADTYPPGRPLGSGRAVRAASRATYGRPIADVERELAERHRTFSAPKQKPVVGRVDE